MSVDDESVCIAVTAAPVDGKANEAMQRFIAKTLDLPKSSVMLRSGASSRNKLVEITGMTKERVLKKMKETIHD